MFIVVWSFIKEQDPLYTDLISQSFLSLPAGFLIPLGLRQAQVLCSLHCPLLIYMVPFTKRGGGESPPPPPSLELLSESLEPTLPPACSL